MSLVLLVGSLAGCGVAAPRVVTGSAAPVASRQATPPRHVTATPLRSTVSGGLRAGAVVRDGFTGLRTFLNRGNGFAITDLPQAGGATYPVATTDGGRVWRIDGPPLHIPAAQGAAAVNQAGVSAPRIYFAWCSGCNNLIDLTPDAGTRWWAVRLPGQILSLVGSPYRREGLTAVVEGPTSDPRGRGASLWVYSSSDGRRWTYSSSMSAVS